MPSFIFAISLFCTGNQAAWAHEPHDGDIYASLGFFGYRTDAPNLNDPYFAPGLIAEADIDYHGGVEIGLFYLRNPFVMHRGGRTLVERVQRIYITTGYRHWFSSWVSAAAAFSSSYSMGDAEVVRNDFAGLERPRTSAHDITEYGFDFSVQSEVWRERRFSVVVDGRYNLSVTKKPGEESNHYGLFVGLKYFVQSRVRAPGADLE